MNLFQFYSLEATDKGTWHSYIENYYAHKFGPTQHLPIKLLEIGVDQGASIYLWQKWFTQGEFVGIDVNPQGLERIGKFPRTSAYLADGYCFDTLNKFSDSYFDYIIEDGPHSLDTQKWAAQHWVQKLKPGGCLIIEDIQNNFADFEEIKRVVPPGYAVNYIDMRPMKNRWDDFIVEITRL